MAADGTIFIEIDPTGAVVGAKRVERSLDRVGNSADKLKVKTGGVRKGLTEVSRGLIGPLGLAAAAAAVAAALSKTIGVATRFEKSISELSAITGATGKDLTFLTDQAKLLGRTTTLSASQVATGFKLIASAKPDLLESGAALTEVTEQAITLAEAAGIELPAAATALAGSLNQFQAPAEEAGRFINVLAAGSKRGAAEIPELTESLKAAGTVAASAGLSFEETIANIESLAEVNLKGAESGTALRNIILLLQKQGIDKLNPAVVGLTSALENLNAEQRSDVEILKIFGVRNFAAVTALLARTQKTRDLQKAITGTLTAEEQALINTDNLDGSTKALNSAIEGLAISLGSVLVPGLQETNSFLANYINVVTDALDETIAFATGIRNAIGGATDTNADFLRNVADKSLEEIEDRIREENQTLNTLLDKSVSAAALVAGRQTFGISTALAQGEIDEVERFIALLKRARTEAQQEEKKVESDADIKARIAAAEAQAKFLAEQEKLEADRVKAAEAAADAAKRAAEEQADSFARLTEGLNPLDAALKELNEAEAVLQRQRELGLITADEEIVLQGQLTDAFRDALDPIGALNEKLAEEQALAKLSNAERAVEARVISEVNALKKAGVEDADAQADAIRKSVQETQALTEAQNENKAVQEVVNEELERQKSLLEEIKGPQEEMNETLAALNQLLADDAISLEEFNTKLADLRNTTLAGQTSVEAGFERGFISAQENLNDFASLSEKIVTDSFQGMEDTVVNFAKTGKLEIGSLVDSILEDFVRLQARQALAGALGAPGKNGGKGTGLFGLATSLFSQSQGGPAVGGGGGEGSTAGGASGFAGLASGIASLFSQNQDGGIERNPTISTLAEKGPEAVIPLKGGKVPVEVKEPSKPPINVNNVFNISTPDVGSFGRSTGQVGLMMGQAFQTAIGRNG